MLNKASLDNANGRPLYSENVNHTADNSINKNFLITVKAEIITTDTYFCKYIDIAEPNQ